MQSKLKEELHRMIDEIEDERALMLIKEEQLNELNEALKESEAGETISYEEYVKHINERKKKLST